MATRRHTTSCTMDCPDTCTLTVTVTDGRVTRIAGAREGHPDTAGFICTKVARFHRRLYHPDRLHYPMRRTGPKGEGRFERISWSEAVAEITERFTAIRERWGGEAILPFHYGGSNGLLGDELIDHLYFARLGASRCGKTLCAAPSSAVMAGMYGKMPGVAFADFPEAELIVIWGANPKVSNIHLMPYLKAARRRGATIVAIDPRNTFSDGEIDRHLGLRPGTDLPLALGLIHTWMSGDRFDHAFLNEHGEGLEPFVEAAREWPAERAAAECGIDAADILWLAERYAAASPALIRPGWGVERNRNGGQALAAIFAIPALMGKFGVRGGGYAMSNSAATRFDRAAVIGDLDWHARELNQTRLGHWLTAREVNPPVMGLFVYNCNPAATVPDQAAVLTGLAREDLFTVVFDQVMTDSARYADILLPAVTFLEQREIRKGYGSFVTGGVRPVTDAPGEALPNETVFARLGRAMGFADAPFTWDGDALFERVTAALSLNGAPADAARLGEGGTQQVDFDGNGPVQFESVFPGTASGRVNLSPPCLGDAPYRFRPAGGGRYPLALISPATEKLVNSTLGEFNYPELRVTLHPADAATRGIAAGDLVRVFNERGEVVCAAELSASVREGVAVMPKGAWRKASANGFTATALAPDSVNVVGGGACFNDARVEVERR